MTCSVCSCCKVGSSCRGRCADPNRTDATSLTAMRAIVMHETGDPDVLKYEEAERPEPADGEVLVRVHAASVNPIDWKYRRGFVPTDLPAVLGIDVSGTVEVS